MSKATETIKEIKSFDWKGYGLLFVIVLITVFTCPDSFKGQKVSLHHVWYYGWITAVSTGAGVLPFFLFSEPNKFWMGVSNGELRFQQK